MTEIGITVGDAKRLIAAASPEAARQLGQGLAGFCSQARYNRAAAAALADPAAALTAEERRAVAALVECGSDVRDVGLHIRLSRLEYARLAAAARESGESISEYVRGVLAVEER